MRYRTWLIPLLASLLSVAIAYYWVDSPGYTDADYYMATGLRLARGEGFTQPFIWNYLALPDGIPQPSHLYWMPLASIVSAMPMWVLGASYRAAQLPFLLLTILLAPATAWLRWSMDREEGAALLAGLLAAFSGFYLPFFLTTDTFILYAWIGGGTLALAAAFARHPGRNKALGLGIGLGLAHLTRADGVLFLAPIAVALMTARTQRSRHIGWLAVGYSTIMIPWFVRLFLVTDAPWPPGASRALWLRDYNELFSYPPDRLTAGHLLSSGWLAITRDRLRALGQNVVSFLVVTGSVVIGPLSAVAGWGRRRDPLISVTLAYLVSLLAVMSLAFPFPGPRGGFFHSSAALLPILWALTPSGLRAAVRWGERRRGWIPEIAWIRFSAGLVVILALSTGFLVWQRLILPSQMGGGWGDSLRTYHRAGEILQREGARRVAVNNPPGFWLATGIEAVVIPDGDLSAIDRVVSDFDVGWLILDSNHPDGLREFYETPQSVPRFELRESLSEGTAAPVYIFRVRPK
jgi:hypothetical protein